MPRGSAGLSRMQSGQLLRGAVRLQVECVLSGVDRLQTSSVFWAMSPITRDYGDRAKASEYLSGMFV